MAPDSKFAIGCLPGKIEIRFQRVGDFDKRACVGRYSQYLTRADEINVKIGANRKSARVQLFFTVSGAFFARAPFFHFRWVIANNTLQSARTVHCTQISRRLHTQV